MICYSPAEGDSEQDGAGHTRLPQVRALPVMWTIFKVFIEFVILLLFYVLVSLAPGCN